LAFGTGYQRSDTRVAVAGGYVYWLTPAEDDARRIFLVRLSTR
jgi:hypothetical protein